MQIVVVVVFVVVVVVVVVVEVMILQERIELHINKSKERLISAASNCTNNKY